MCTIKKKKSEQKYIEWKSEEVACSASVVHLTNLKWLFVNQYDLDKFIIYNPILHYVQGW